MKKIILFTVCLLFAYSLQAQKSEIEKLLIDSDEIAMEGILQVLEDKDNEEADAFVNTFIDICKAQERYYLMNQVIMRLYVASFPQKPTGSLLKIMHSYGILIGEKAPNFSLNDSTMLYDVLGKKTLLFFYESSCYLCHDEINQLKINYESLNQKSIQLITIDCNVEETIPRIWQYNIADSQGERYRPFGVLSTPTYILLDETGIVIERQNRFEYIDF